MRLFVLTHLKATNSGMLFLSSKHFRSLQNHCGYFDSNDSEDVKVLLEPLTDKLNISFCPENHEVITIHELFKTDFPII